MLYMRFLIYSLRTNRPVRVLMSGEQMKYVNLTVISMDESSFAALIRGRKTPVIITYDQILAVSYARGDNGDTAKDMFNTLLKEDLSMTKTIHIKGIMCGHCEMRVKKALEALPFIETAQVSYETGTAVVSVRDSFDEAKVKAAVTEAGYEFVSAE